MIFENDQEAIQYIKDNSKLSPFIVKARDQHKELSALLEGDGFMDELLTRIEHIETEEKALARKKYSRSIVDFFERLFQPIQNVFSATGGSKKYNIENESMLTEYLEKISKIRDGKSIQDFVENKWMTLYHIDPNGIIFMEYNSEDDKVFPTYKSINSIRAYKPKGQLLEVVLFEAERLENGDQKWRIVDDVVDRCFIQKGESFTLVEEETFEHPFGEVPALINSNIEKVNYPIKLSPISKIVEACKEYARDQSIKTLYKFLNGFPIHWRYVTQCRECTGTGKTGGKPCNECDGKGYYKKKDVTDMVTLPVPHGDQVKLAPDIAGFISPDLNTWQRYNEELEIQERNTHKTMWGSYVSEGGNETATGRWIDVQPVINRLNKYADASEFVEWKISNWVWKYMNPSSDESVAMISYGRRYIIESQDVILEKYQTTKGQGASNVILDKMLAEYLTAKYKADPMWLREELLKAKVEPYIHLGIAEVSNIFGSREALKKSEFNKWWGLLSFDDFNKEADALRDEYDAWFEENYQVSNQLNNQNIETDGDD